MRIIYIFITLTVMTMFASCGSSKNAQEPSGRYQEKTPGTAEPKDITYLANILSGNETAEWEAVKVPVTLTLRQPKTMSVGGTLTMVRNKSLHLSLRFFGMEVGAVYITSDSVFGYAKLQKLYVAESIGSMLGGYPASIGNLQSLLAGHVFQLGKDKMDIRECVLATDGDGFYTITPPAAPEDVDYRFTVSIPANAVSRLDICQGGKEKAVVTYSTARPSVPGITAGKLCLDIHSSETPIEACIDLNLNKAEYGSRAIGRPFAIPSGYRRVERGALMQLLSGL